MYLKLMGPEDAPDSDSRKTYRLIQQVVNVGFERDDKGKAFANVTMEDETLNTYGPLEGNVYVLNDQGKTVGTFGSAVIPNDGTFGHYLPPRQVTRV